jgi:hypothetical protein
VAISDIYDFDSGLISVAATSQTPTMYIATTSTKRSWVVGVRVSIGVTAAAAGNSVLFTLARAGNSPSGGTTVTGRAHDSSAAAAFTTSASAASAFSISPTLGNILWEMELPQTTGSSWEEFPPLGYEWGVPASGFLACFVTNSVSTSTPVQFQLVVSE